MWRIKFWNKRFVGKDVIILDEKREVSFFQFPELNRMSFIDHFIFTRNNGVSEFPFDSLNVSSGVGDNSDCVRENRSRLHKLMGGDYTLYLNQVHGSRALIFRNFASFKGKNSTTQFYCADAAITNIPEVSIVIQTADCQAVLIVDSTKRVVANVHVGWRGSISRILEKTVSKMVQCFGCNPVDIVAALSPSLGPCCAEFLNHEKQFPLIFSQYRVGVCNFDFWKISKQQLCNAGVPTDSIYCSNICTRCNSDLFFSYRKDKITGRFASSIIIR